MLQALIMASTPGHASAWSRLYSSTFSARKPITQP